MNLEPSAVAKAAGEVILGPATEVVPRWVEALLSSHRASPDEWEPRIRV